MRKLRERLWQRCTVSHAGKGTNSVTVEHKPGFVVFTE
jgi:hypothetical protein